MSYLPRWIVSSAAYSITLAPTVLSGTVALSPVVNPSYAIPILYQITTNSSGDGTGTSDMAAEGYITLTGSVATAHRSIDNNGNVTTTYYFYVVEFRPSALRQAVGGASGPRSFALPSGQNEPASVTVLPSIYKGNYVNILVDPR